MKFTFDSQTNYKDTFREYVSELNNLKEVPTQEERHDIVASLLDEYYQATEDLPPSDALNMLTVFYLKDWYTNSKKNKMYEENSFLTYAQIKKRMKDERGDNLLDTYAHDGTNRAIMTRDYMRSWRQRLQLDYMSVYLAKVKSFYAEGESCYHDET